MPVATIQTKLVRSFMKVMIAAFFCVFVVVAAMNYNAARNILSQTQEQMMRALEAKGRTLVQNNSLALSGMVGDNAFTSVQQLVLRTVQDDPDVVYGIYSDRLGNAWVHANDSVDSVDAVVPLVLTDSIAHWALQNQSWASRVVSEKPVQIIEFCHPVYLDEELVGVIRYGLSTQSLQDANQMAKKANLYALLNTFIFLVIVCLLTMYFSFLVIRKQSRRFSAPIIRLRTEAQTISEGHYGVAVDVESDDEIGDLANSFEEMRQKVKQYTDHLEELVDEKMRQVRDILDNIDQGLFTVNFDGSINAEFSRATTRMLLHPDSLHITIQQILHLDESQFSEWKDWISVVRLRHKHMRWEKLLRIAPFREQIVTGPDQNQMVLYLSYQKVFDKDGNLSRLMVLAQDVTETRRVERIVQEEQEKHENEVRMILGIVNNVPEVIRDFFRDVDDCILRVRKNIEILQHTSMPLPHSVMGLLARDIHTIKGNSSSYGFERLGKLAHAAEDLLEKIRQARIEDVKTLLFTFHDAIEEMVIERKNIGATAQRLRGTRGSLMICLPEQKVLYLQRIAQTLLRETLEQAHNPFIPLAEACCALRKVSLRDLTGKYAAMIARVAEKTQKRIVFESSPPDLEVDPASFLSANDSLVHIIRNAVDHGIESPEERKQSGKADTGRIGLHVQEEPDRLMLEVRDDGRGIDVDRLGRVAVAKGMITAEYFHQLTRRQKLDLAFLSGLSTSIDVTDYSGRGVGMEAAREAIKRIGGTIVLESEPGQGTVVRLEVPKS